ncbi:MAG: HAD family phosphatase [Clostridiales bacterium]|nr:HAD family phosphatase [Clostridiales bacterium]
MVKLIVSDLDGTLLNADEKVSSANRKAFWAVWRKGIPIAICSGRGPLNIRKIIKKENLPPCYALGYNGAFCMDPQGEEIFTGYVSQEGLHACNRIFDEENVTYAVMWAQGVALNRDVADFTSANGKPFHEAAKFWNRITWDQESFVKAQKTGIHKLIYIDDTPARLNHVRKRIEEVKEVTIMSSWEDNFELMPQGVNKGTATALLAEKFAVEAKDVMALGDQENDMEMIAFAGYSVAMGNGTNKIKEIAKYETAHHQQDGVAKAIEKLVLTQ